MAVTNLKAGIVARSPGVFGEQSYLEEINGDLWWRMQLHSEQSGSEPPVGLNSESDSLTKTTESIYSGCPLWNLEKVWNVFQVLSWLSRFSEYLAGDPYVLSLGLGLIVFLIV